MSVVQSSRRPDSAPRPQAVPDRERDDATSATPSTPAAESGLSVVPRPTLSRRERLELALLRRYREHRDLRARDELTERLMPLVRSIAYKYRASSEPLEDLVQAGSVGLVKAIERFDLDSGYRFVSFAAPTIRGEVQRHFRDHCWDVHVPRGVQELHQQIRAQQRRTAESNGREATTDDLVAALQVSKARVLDAIAAAATYDALSLDYPAGEAFAALERHGSCDRGYVRVENDDAIEHAMNVLDERERRVLHWRFHDELLQREIAVRLGVSQMQVSRIIRDALQRMSAYMAAEQRQLAA